jgi:uncharacterized protein (DUF2336 family)
LSGSSDIGLLFTGGIFLSPSGLLMIVRHFLVSTQNASVAERAQAIDALVQSYLNGQLSPVDRTEAEAVLTTLLDDPSPVIRRALAEAVALSKNIPRPIITGLANDQSEVSVVVLRQSPLLSDADLIECAKIGDGFAQSAIALRSKVSARVADGLAEFGSCEALISLAMNLEAEIADISLHRMIERFGSNGELREAILARSYLSAAVRADLVSAAALSLSAFVISSSWIAQERAERAARESWEKSIIMIAIEEARSFHDGPLALVQHLRKRGQLTSGLILRSLLSGHSHLFEAALSELSNMPLNNVCGHVRNFRHAGFNALYARAGLPVSLLPVFKSALNSLAQDKTKIIGSGELIVRHVERVLADCKAMKQAEALRQNARSLYAKIAA